MKKLVSLFAVMAMLVLCMGSFASCVPANTVQVEGLSLSIEDVAVEGSYDMGVGTSEAKTISVKTEAGEEVEGDITFKTSDVNVVKVSKYGLLTGVSIGDAKVTVETDAGREVVTVNVVPKAVVANTTMNLLFGEGVDASLAQGSVGATANPDTAVVTYASKDENVATVDAEGTVVAVAEGTTTVEVTATEKGKSSVTEVEVVVSGATDTAVITFTVDITEGLSSAGLTELPSYLDVYVAGLQGGSDWPSVAGWGDTCAAKRMTAVEDKANVYTLEYTVDLTKTVTDADGVVTPAISRDANYKYVIIGRDGDTVVTAKVGYDQFNGSPTDNRPIFLNGTFNQVDTVTLFNEIPADPRVPAVDYTVTFVLHVANPVADGKNVALVGAFADMSWDPTGGANGEYVLAYNADANTYSITIEFSSNTGKTPQFKFTIGGTWDSEFNGGICSYTEGGDAIGDGNMELDVTAAVDGVLTIELYVAN